MDRLLLPTHGSGLRKLLLAHAMGGGGGVLKTVSGPLVTVTDALAKPAKSLVVNFAPVQAAGTPSPDNVLPISGWTGVTGYRTGVNLCDIGNPLFTASNESQFISYNSYINNGVLMNGGRVGVANGTGLTFSAVAGCNYTISFMPGGESANYAIVSTNIGSNNVWLNYAYVLFQETTVGQRKCITFTFPSGYTHVFFAGFSATKYGSWESDIQLELGASPTSYTPYTGTTYSVDWTDEAGTVYGGYVDLVSGVLVKEWAAINLNSNSSWNSYGTGDAFFVYHVESTMPTINYAPGLCDMFPTKTIASPSISTAYIRFGGNDNALYVYNVNQLGVTSTSEWKEYIGTTGINVAYPLATPITYQLTPQTIAMLRGTDNVWSNANGDVSLTYLAKK